MSLDNYEAVYDFYLGHRQSRPVARAAYALLAARYRPGCAAQGTSAIVSANSCGAGRPC